LVVQGSLACLRTAIDDLTPDSMVLARRFEIMFQRPHDWRDPKTFNETLFSSMRYYRPAILRRIIAEQLSVDATGGPPPDYKFFCQLSRGFSFVRVGLYALKGRTVFGEMTWYPAAGVGRFTPDRYDRFRGDFLHLPGPTPRFKWISPLPHRGSEAGQEPTAPPQ
jgi:hypothetical protein